MLPRSSLSKRKSEALNGDFQNMHLAVFPYQIEFQKDTNLQIQLYFEKKFQIIGKISTPVPPCKKGTKYQMNSLDNLIFFNLYRSSNVVYQWSGYRIHENDEEQYKDSCTINLKEIVTNYIIPQKSAESRSNESLLKLGYVNQEIKLKLPKLGILLSVNLLISDDVKKIQKAISRKYLKESHQKFPHVELLKVDSKKQLNNVTNLQRKDSKQILNTLKPKEKREKPQFHSIENVFQYPDKVLSHVEILTESDFFETKRNAEQNRSCQSNHSEEVAAEAKRGILLLESIQTKKSNIQNQSSGLQVIPQEIRSSQQTGKSNLPLRFQPKQKENTYNALTPNPKLPFRPTKQQTQQTQMPTKQTFSLKKTIIIIALTFFLIVSGVAVANGSNKNRKVSKK